MAATIVHAPRRKKLNTMNTSPGEGRSTRASKYVRLESKTPLRTAAAYPRSIQKRRNVEPRAPTNRSGWALLPAECARTG
jgi:site-specific DNA-cytosine methylase